MHQQHAIDRRVRQRQLELVDQRRQRRLRGRPFHHALRGRHEGQATLGLLAEQPEIGRGVADAEDALSARIDPALADAAADEMPRHGAEPLAVEIAQIDDVDGHGAILPRTPVRLTAFNCSEVNHATVRPDIHEEDHMPAETKLFRCLKDNYGVLIHDPASGATAAIDAPEAAPVEAALKATGWKLTDILVTHHHADHTGGIAELKKKYHCRVVAPKAEAGKNPAGRRDRERGRQGQRREARGQRDRNARPHRAATSPTGFTATSSPSPATRCSRSAAAASSRARPR